MKNVKEDAILYILTGVLQRCEGNGIGLLESIICDVKEDQFSIPADDPEKEHMDEILNESLRLLETASIFLTNSHNS